MTHSAAAEVTIVLRWITGHNGIHENERVEKEAKKTAGGDSSLVHTLPEACKEVFQSAGLRRTRGTSRGSKSKWSSTIGAP